MKVLIISHCQLSVEYSIGKTLASLFSAFNKNELCQLYVHTGLPDIDICKSYYRLTDKDVLKGLLTCGAKGKEVSATDVLLKDECNKSEKPHSVGKFKELLRDVLWKISKWFGRDLKKWLIKEKPTCIFVAVGSGKFLYDIALKISKIYNIPIITYVCDDFYFNNTDKSLIGKLWSRELRKKSDKLFTSSKVLVSICREMSELYEKTFNIPAYTVMTGANISTKKEFDEKAQIKNIRYFGKLSLNRYKSILDIGKALDELNLFYGGEFSLDVFCGNITEEQRKAFCGIKSVKFHNFVRGEDFNREFFSSDALLNVEAFDYITKARVKYSVSTKIADYIASGIPIFAYGPDGIASIEHLKRNDCAIIATQSKDLTSKLKELFFEKQTVNKILANASYTFEKYHNGKTVSGELYNICKSIEE